IAIDFHGGPRSSLLAWLSRAPTRIGYDIPGRAWMYTTRVARARALRPRHSVENQWDLLAPLGIAPADRSRWPVEMTPPPDMAAAIGRRLAEAGAPPDDRVIVLHVSAGNPFRRWPIAAFAELIAHLVSRDDRRRIVVTSGPADTAAAGRAIEEARARLEPARRDRVIASGDF